MEKEQKRTGVSAGAIEGPASRQPRRLRKDTAPRTDPLPLTPTTSHSNYKWPIIPSSHLHRAKASHKVDVKYAVHAEEHRVARHVAPAALGAAGVLAVENLELPGCANGEAKFGLRR